jgi:hypothetical protein
MAYDAARGQMVLFTGSYTGEGQTWRFGDKPQTFEGKTFTYDGKTWTLRHPTVSPPAEGPMAYDPVLRRIVLVTGEQTWTYDGSTWTPQPVVSPSGPIAYDPAIRRIVLVSGTSSFEPLSTWTYDGKTWTLQDPTVSPPSTAIGPIAYDPILAEIVMVASLDGMGPPAPGQGAWTWTYDGKTWTERAAAPFYWGNFSMDFDPSIGQIVVFGGEKSYRDYVYTDEMFAFDRSHWTMLRPHASPSPRSTASMDYDPAIGYMLLFGGRTGSMSVGPSGHDTNDTWTFEVSGHG